MNRKQENMLGIGIVAILILFLTDKNTSIIVVSNQGMPGNYEEGIPVVVTGIFVNNTFNNVPEIWR